MNHVSSVVYEGICNCGKNHIGETRRNVTVRWNDMHNNIGKYSEPSKHLGQFAEHIFNCKILRRVLNRQRKIYEAYYVMCLRSTLNNQLLLTFLALFQDGVTDKNVFELLLVSLRFYRL